jgi:hypothetical protein
MGIAISAWQLDRPRCERLTERARFADPRSPVSSSRSADVQYVYGDECRYDDEPGDEDRD